MSAYAGALRVWRCRDVQQGALGLAHGVADDSDEIVIDDSGKKDRCWIIAVPLNGLFQPTLATANGEGQKAGDRGNVVADGYYLN
jgi:hypothetical protein